MGVAEQRTWIGLPARIVSLGLVRPSISNTPMHDLTATAVDNSILGFHTGK